MIRKTTQVMGWFEPDRYDGLPAALDLVPGPINNPQEDPASGSTLPANGHCAYIFFGFVGISNINLGSWRAEFLLN